MRYCFDNLQKEDASSFFDQISGGYHINLKNNITLIQIHVFNLLLHRMERNSRYGKIVLYIILHISSPRESCILHKPCKPFQHLDPSVYVLGFSSPSSHYIYIKDQCNIISNSTPSQKNNNFINGCLANYSSRNVLRIVHVD